MKSSDTFIRTKDTFIVPKLAQEVLHFFSHNQLRLQQIERPFPFFMGLSICPYAKLPIVGVARDIQFWMAHARIAIWRALCL